MKFINRLLIILTFATIFSFNAFNAFSQDSEAEIKSEQPQEAKDIRTEEEINEEKEVRKFIESFIKEMDDKKDLNKISEKFLIANFKERFAKKNNLIDALSEEFSKDLSDSERFRANTEVINLIRLTVISMYGSGFNFDSQGLESVDGIKQFLPKTVLDIAEKNRFLASIIKKEFTSKNSDEVVLEPKIESVIELRELIDDFHSINDAMRKHIDAQPTTWHETQQKREAEIKNTFDYYHAKPCEDEDCEGLEEKQIIYHVDSFPFCILVVNEFGSYKVLNIFLRMD
jgi:hypothetical protein